MKPAEMASPSLGESLTVFLPPPSDPDLTESLRQGPCPLNTQPLSAVWGKRGRGTEGGKKKTLKPNNEIKSHATANLHFNTASCSLTATCTITKLRRRDYVPRGQTWAARDVSAQVNTYLNLTLKKSGSAGLLPRPPLKETTAQKNPDNEKNEKSSNLKTPTQPIKKPQNKTKIKKKNPSSFFSFEEGIGAQVEAHALRAPGTGASRPPPARARPPPPRTLPAPLPGSARLTKPRRRGAPARRRTRPGSRGRLRRGRAARRPHAPTLAFSRGLKRSWCTKGLRGGGPRSRLPPAQHPRPRLLNFMAGQDEGRARRGRGRGAAAAGPGRRRRRRRSRSAGGSGGRSAPRWSPAPALPARACALRAGYSGSAARRFPPRLARGSAGRWEAAAAGAGWALTLPPSFPPPPYPPSQRPLGHAGSAAPPGGIRGTARPRPGSAPAPHPRREQREWGGSGGDRPGTIATLGLAPRSNPGTGDPPGVRQRGGMQNKKGSGEGLQMGLRCRRCRWCLGDHRRRTWEKPGVVLASRDWNWWGPRGKLCSKQT